MFPLQAELDFIQDEPSLEKLLKQYESVFGYELGCLKGFKVRIPVDESVKPKFFRARRVPYALREGVEAELDRLERQAIVKKVEYSRWAAPVVPVPKDGGGAVRLCGDYKLTVNAAAPVDSYPLPRTEDMFAILEGGEKFTKLDLSHAYQQLELHEETGILDDQYPYIGQLVYNLVSTQQWAFFNARWIRGWQAFRSVWFVSTTY
jgi:hypothetical protein